MKLFPWFLLGIAIMIILWRGCGDDTAALDATRHEADSLRAAFAAVVAHDSTVTADFQDYYIWAQDTITRLTQVTDSGRNALRFKDTRLRKLLAMAGQQAVATGDTDLARRVTEFEQLYNTAVDNVSMLLETGDRKDSIYASEITKAVQTIDSKDSTISDMKAAFFHLSDVQARTQAIADKLNRQTEKRWGIGPYVGYGLTKEGLRPSVGISVQLPLIRF